MHAAVMGAGALHDAIWNVTWAKVGSLVGTRSQDGNVRKASLMAPFLLRAEHCIVQLKRKDNTLKKGELQCHRHS